MQYDTSDDLTFKSDLNEFHNHMPWVGVANDPRWHLSAPRDEL
jgi:hypothetical protein